MFQEDAMRVRIDGHAETEELTNETSMFQALDRSPSPSPLLALTCLQHSHRDDCLETEKSSGRRRTGADVCASNQWISWASGGLRQSPLTTSY